MVSANFGKFLPRAGRGDGLPLINCVSSAVRYIHYFAPAAHLFAGVTIYPTRAASSRSRSRAELINVFSKRGRPAAVAAAPHFIPSSPWRNCDRRNLSPDSLSPVRVNPLLARSRRVVGRSVTRPPVCAGFKLRRDISRGNNARLTNLSRRIAMLSIRRRPPDLIRRLHRE